MILLLRFVRFIERRLNDVHWVDLGDFLLFQPNSFKKIKKNFLNKNECSCLSTRFFKKVEAALGLGFADLVRKVRLEGVAVVVQSSFRDDTIAVPKAYRRPGDPPFIFSGQRRSLETCRRTPICELFLSC